LEWWRARLGGVLPSNRVILPITERKTSSLDQTFGIIVGIACQDEPLGCFSHPPPGGRVHCHLLERTLQVTRNIGIECQSGRTVPDQVLCSPTQRGNDGRNPTRRCLVDDESPEFVDRGEDEGVRVYVGPDQLIATTETKERDVGDSFTDDLLLELGFLRSVSDDVERKSEATFLQASDRGDERSDVS